MYPNCNADDCMVFYESMPQWIDFVLKSRGYWTNNWRFCRQLEQNWVYVYSFVSHLALQHTFLLLINVIFFLHICAQFCVVLYPIFKPTKKHVKCSWLYVEDEYVQKVINFVCNYRCNVGALFYFNKGVINEWEEPTTILKAPITNHIRDFVLYLEKY